MRRCLFSGLLAFATLLVPLPTAARGRVDGVREVTASPRAIIPLHTRIRFTTLVVLPDGDDILDVICGDKDYWVVSAAGNMAHVKPAQQGASTNLNLVTTSGTVYSFLLTESTEGDPDLKVYVNADPETRREKPKFVAASRVDELQAELARVRGEAEAAARKAREDLDAYRQQYPNRLQFVYGSVRYEKPFLVRAVWNDGQFTYIRSDARELPAVYELKDGAPALLNFQVQGDTYVIPKVVDLGYLALGKAKLVFHETR